MSINATAKAKIFVGSPSATISELADFEADTYIEIKEVEDLGSWGAEAKEISFISLADSHVRRRAGSIDSGKVALVAARDPLDAGQQILAQNIGSHLPFAFKVELNDAPNDAGLPTTFYFRAVIMSAQNKFGKADDLTMTDFTLGIDGAILELPAAYVIAMTPAPGALTAGVHSSVYAGETIEATGGDGAVSYSIVAGALPSGLTLHSATGVIEGTPSAAGTFNFSIKATFASGGSKTVAYSIVVS
jgi:hypothetical protein